MKNILCSLFFVSFLFSCDTNDDDFYNTSYARVPNLVQIQIPTNFTVGNYIYVNASINRLLAEPNQPNLLDIRETTGNASSFSFTYLLEKKISPTNWELVDASAPNIDLNNGSFETGSFYKANAIFDATSDSYKYLNGIKLTSTGDYRLSFGYNSNSTNQVELRSNSLNGNIFLTLFTTANNLDSEGYYHFTVN